ncbi:MAG: DHH family phosphoesterase [Bacteroidales bacterium]|jgi:phosphoesterase RecJ-like protein|nr:DHH family phosphoesterase [Bacteroidales bacterium]
MLSFTNDDIEKLKHYIDKSNSCALLSHYNPDGDSLGSCVALFSYLKDKNKDVYVIIPNEYPAFLDFILKDVCFCVARKHLDKAKEVLEKSDLIISLDHNDFKRTGDDIKECFENLKSTKILIDHHPNPNKEAYDLIFSETSSSSTCEVLYEVLYALEKSNKFLSPKIVDALYVGLCTDTGSFSYACNNKRTYEVAGTLVENGVNVEVMHHKLYNTFTESHLRLLGFCLMYRLRVFNKKGAAFIYLTKEDLAKFRYKVGDLEGVVNYCLMIKGITFGALITERPDRIRISFRSSSDTFNVNSFAREHWNGGGHPKAAGGHCFEDLDYVIEKITKQIETFPNV